LEAAAMGRPIITTDTAGCRDVVVDNETGLLCRVRDAIDLSEKIEN
jgi:glycosyltransferase involved in cell wall biosynthesis